MVYGDYEAMLTFFSVIIDLWLDSAYIFPASSQTVFFNAFLSYKFYFVTKFVPVFVFFEFTEIMPSS